MHFSFIARHKLVGVDHLRTDEGVYLPDRGENLQARACRQARKGLAIWLCAERHHDAAAYRSREGWSDMTAGQ